MNDTGTTVPCPCCDGAGWIPHRGKQLCCLFCAGDGDVDLGVANAYWIADAAFAARYHAEALRVGQRAGEGIAEGMERSQRARARAAHDRLCRRGTYRSMVDELSLWIGIHVLRLSAWAVDTYTRITRRR